MDSYLERLRRELEDAIAGASAPAQGPVGKWNSAQILEHLFLTYTTTNRGLQSAWNTALRWPRGPL